MTKHTWNMESDIQPDSITVNGIEYIKKIDTRAKAAAAELNKPGPFKNLDSKGFKQAMNFDSFAVAVKLDRSVEVEFFWHGNHTATIMSGRELAPDERYVVPLLTGSMEVRLV